MKKNIAKLIFLEFEPQKGISLLFIILIMSVILAIGLGISAILIPQIKMMKEIGYSVIAFYTADSGIESVLYQDNKLCYPPNCTTTSPGVCKSDCTGLPGGYTTSTILENQARYEVKFSTSTDGTAIIKSIGSYKKTKRAIEATK